MKSISLMFSSHIYLDMVKWLQPLNSKLSESTVFVWSTVDVRVNGIIAPVILLRHRYILSYIIEVSSLIHRVYAYLDGSHVVADTEGSITFI